MKKLIMLLAVLAMGLGASAQLSVGVRESHYVNVSYRFMHNWGVKLEQSVYGEKVGYQYFRLYASYTQSLGFISLKAQPYFGMTYNNSYSNGGIVLGASLNACKLLDVDAAVIPHRDSGMGYTTCYYGGLALNFGSGLSITAAYTNRPEYREPEKRLRGGFRFNVGHLSVHPELSIPVGSGAGRTVRMLMSMGYSF